VFVLKKQLFHRDRGYFGNPSIQEELIMKRLTKFETIIIEAIFKCNNENVYIEQIKRQYNEMKVVRREYTGAGFYTHFEISDKKLSLGENVNFELGGIEADIKGFKMEAGFIIFIRSGFIDFLEGYSYVDVWNREKKIKQLYVVDSKGKLTKYS
jgi:hypothetical protein